jgi:HSP20 family molecular chaperone IbpA
MNLEDGFTAGPLTDIDLDETDSHFLLSLDLPGVPRENIDIQVTGNRLHIVADRRAEGRGRRGAMREQSHFEQSLVLPQGIDSTKVEADYRDGVLHIAIPKGEIHKARKVELGEPGKGFFARLREKMESLGSSSSSDENDAEGTVEIHGDDEGTSREAEMAERKDKGRAA